MHVHKNELLQYIIDHSDTPIFRVLRHLQKQPINLDAYQLVFDIAFPA